MNWIELLTNEVNRTYKTTEDLMNLVKDDTLEWKPKSGQNWMTVGQLLKHLTEACGQNFKGLVTGDWGFPTNEGLSALPVEQMLPPAESMSTIVSVAEAKLLLEGDRKLTLSMLKRCLPVSLASQQVSAPWDPTKMPLGQRLLHMVWHLNQHKGQLYYYLKLQGVPVNTTHLWGASL